MEKEENEEIVQDVPPVKKRPIKKIIIIGLSVLVVLGAGTFGTLYFLSHWGSGKKVATPEQRPLIGNMWSIDPFVVNLADNQGERYLKVVMQFEVSDPMVSAQLEQLKPKLRDNVMDLLTAKSYAELMDSGGKQRLRDEIVLRLNSFLSKGGIVRVYFTEFVIQ
jgi:flagellar protein FliL